MTVTPPNLNTGRAGGRAAGVSVDKGSGRAGIRTQHQPMCFSNVAAGGRAEPGTSGVLLALGCANVPNHS